MATWLLSACYRHTGVWGKILNIIFKHFHNLYVLVCCYHMCMTTKTQLLQIIRKTCLRCMCGSFQEVDLCSTQERINIGLEKCPLYPYRYGSDPTAAKKGIKPSCGYTPKTK